MYMDEGQPEPGITEVPQVLHSSFQQLGDLKTFKHKLCKIVRQADNADLESILEHIQSTLNNSQSLTSEDPCTQLAAEILGVYPSQLVQECKRYGFFCAWLKQ